MASILIVDDDRNVLSSLRRLVTYNGSFEAEYFENPMLALDRVAETEFDVIVSDYHMKKMDGVRFLEETRHYSPDSTRILLSGLADMNVLAQSINRCGIYHYFTKPWNDDEVLRVLAEAIETRKSAVNQKRAAELVSDNKYKYSVSNFVEHFSMESQATSASPINHDLVMAALERSFSILGFDYFNLSTYVYDGMGKGFSWDACTSSYSNYPGKLLDYYRQHKTLAKVNPVNRLIVDKSSGKTNDMVYGTWKEAYQEMINDQDICTNTGTRVHLMSMASDMYRVTAEYGIMDGVFVSLTEMKKHIVLYLGTKGSLKDGEANPELWKSLHAIIQLASQAIRNLPSNMRYNSAESQDVSARVELTAKQKQILRTFLDDSSASLKSAARSHNITVDCVNFHLKKIRSVLNKPRASSHALAVWAKSLDLI